jgi:hypothetical protein
MQRPTLLKKTYDVELWTDQGESGPVFAVKHHARRVRLAASLAEAEALFDRLIGQTRLARAH